MRTVAFLIAASPNDAFYSQIAAISAALRCLDWVRWRPSVHVFVGGDRTADPVADWRPFLQGVEISWTPSWRYEREGDWAQSDDVFRCAPPKADVLVALDADTFPLRTIEPMLDRVYATGAMAGTIAHFPTVLGFDFDPRTCAFAVRPGQPSLRTVWQQIANGLLHRPLDFAYVHTLVPPGSPNPRATPFFLNFGVVAFTSAVFERIAPLYLELRPQVATRLTTDDFSGQVALALASVGAGVRTWALPLRYNFPNYPLAETLYPVERDSVAILHYLRTVEFDRHRIFTSAIEYQRFLSLPLKGIDARFREQVLAVLGSDYPFPRNPAEGARHT